MKNRLKPGVQSECESYDDQDVICGRTVAAIAIQADIFAVVVVVQDVFKGGLNFCIDRFGCRAE